VPFRQLLVFRLGCIAAVLTAVVHLAGHVAGPAAPANDVERDIARLATTYGYEFPGGTRRTLMDLVDGFSLTFSVLLSAVGGVGFIVQKRGRADAVLMTSVARVLAGACVVLLVVSLTHFFIVPTIFIALVAVCFAMASVRAPDPV
jgi:hypothetical protein